MQSSFDPFGFFEKWISAHLLHFLIRSLIIVVLIFFLSMRISAYGHYLFKPLWAVETLIYAVFIAGYAIRLDPVMRSRGVWEIVIPMIGAILPFALLLSPPQKWFYTDSMRVRCIFYFMTLSTAFTLWALWTLRGSFSITVEARRLVVQGPYRWIRHPVYLGEILTALAVMLWRLSWINILLYISFASIQLVRARLEEQKLSLVFPEYRSYSVKTFWFLPPARPIKK